MGDNETCVVAFERPTGGGGADEIEAEKNEPKVEPGGTVDVSAGDAGAEPGFEKGGHGADSGKSDEEEHSEVEGTEGVDGAPNRGAGAAGGDHLFAGFVERHKMIIEGTSERPRGGKCPQVMPELSLGCDGRGGREKERGGRFRDERLSLFFDLGGLGELGGGEGEFRCTVFSGGEGWGGAGVVISG